MRSITSWKAMALVLALVVAPFANAAPPEVKDDADFFSFAAVSHADAAIQQIKQLYKKDLHIETFKEVPANLQESLKKEKNKTFAQWAQNQATNNKVDGIYVQICKEPGHLEIVVDAATLKKAFSVKDRDKLRDLLLVHFRDKTFDKGLTEAVGFVRQRLEQNLGPAGVVPSVNIVQDRGGFFSPQVEAKINQEIKEFQQRFKKDLLIETFQTPPADKLKLLDGADAETKSKVFSAWLHERAQSAKADGVFFVICREPPRIQLEVGDATLKKAFTAKDREKLLNLLVEHFKAKNYDKALEETVNFVYDTVDQNVSPAIPAIRDDAKLFSAEAVTKGNTTIRALRRRNHLDVLVETFKEVPADRAKGVDLKEPAARNQFFAAWAKDRQKALGMDGINILICSEPKSLQVAVGPLATAKVFDPAAREQLVKMLLTQFRAEEFDKGLTDALEFIEQTLQKKPVSSGAISGSGLHVAAGGPFGKGDVEPPAPTAGPDKTATGKSEAVAPKPSAPVTDKQASFDPMWIVYGLAGLVALWLVIGIFRGLFGGHRQQPPQQHQPQYPASGPSYGSGNRPPMAGPAPGPSGGYPPPQSVQQASSGGGVLPSVLGGLFGGAAGSWMFDRFVRGSQTPRPPASQGGDAPPPPPQRSSPRPVDQWVPPSPAAPEYSSSGGDFSAPASGSSGGDFGNYEEPYRSSGGDFGSAEPTTSGGDFGSPDTAGTAGGDFGVAEPAAPDTSSGGDYGGPDYSSSQTAGGDFASAEPEPPPSSGGDFASADPTPPPSSGGDFG